MHELRAQARVQPEDRLTLMLASEIGSADIAHFDHPARLSVQGSGNTLRFGFSFKGEFVNVDINLADLGGQAFELALDEIKRREADAS